MSRTRLHDYHIFMILFDDFMRNSNFGIGVLHVKVKYCIFFVLFHRIEYPRGVYEKILKCFYGSGFVI